MNVNAFLYGLYAFLFVIFITAGIALILSILAFQDSRNLQSHQNIARRDGIFSGDVIVQSELRVEGTACFDDSLYVNGPQLQTHKVLAGSLQFSAPIVITQTGQITLQPNTNYRIDTAGSNTITLLLPKVSTAPFAFTIITLSQAGQNNTVNLNLVSGDILCSGNTPCTTINPAYSLPYNPASPDQIILTNDGVHVWFVQGHA